MTEPNESVQVVPPTGELSLADLEKQISEFKKEELPKEKVQETKVEEVKAVVEQPKPEPPTVDSMVIKPTPPPVQQQVSPDKTLEDYNNWIKQQWETNPAEAIASVTRLINKPYEETQRTNLLDKEIVKLSRTLPDFNNDSVKSEMVKVVSENPGRYCDEYGIPRPEYMKDIFYIAKGRANVVPKVKNVVEQPTPVEGKNKVTPPQTVDFNSLSLEDQERYIRSLQK